VSNLKSNGPSRVPKTVFMFSGQGSQYFHMGRALFERPGVFREWMLHLDGIARELCRNSVVDAVYYSGSKTDNFDRTLLTHPAIFMVEYSLAQTLMHAGVMPDMTLGASLGAFAAAAVAGFMDVEDAMAATIKQAVAFETYCQPGAMLAVLAKPSLFDERFLREHSELAAVSSASHFTVAAEYERCLQIEAVLRDRDIVHQRLPVSFAFHSQWIDAAHRPFQAFVDSMAVKTGRIPLVCCAHATVLEELPGDFLWQAARRPIFFQEAIARLELSGPHRYVDAGPSGTLAGSLKYVLPAGSASTVHAILTPYGRDERNLTALLARAA
jgi:bacillaene synthase trans-acting acyltransferase